MKKKLLVLSLVMMMVISLFAGIVNAADKKIGVLIADFSDQFQVYMMDGMKEAAVKYDDIEFIFQDAKYDANRQMNQMENLIIQGADAVVVMAVDTKASIPMVKSALDAGIKVISVNRKLDNQDEVTSYVGSDDVDAGEKLMLQMAKILNGKGNIVILEGGMGHQPQILRQQGIQNILKQFPDIKVVADQTADWYRDKGMAVMENWLQSEMEINGVVAHNDEMAIGAVKALEDAGLAGKVAVGGIDATPEALEYVKKGLMSYTVFQAAKGQGYGSIETAVKVVNGEEVPAAVMIPFELVIDDTVEYYKAKYQ